MQTTLPLEESLATRDRERRDKITMTKTHRSSAHRSALTAHRSPFIRSLKRQSYGKVESEVTLEIRINNRIMAPGVLISRVNGFHTCIQTKKEIV